MWLTNVSMLAVSSLQLVCVCVCLCVCASFLHVGHEKWDLSFIHVPRAETDGLTDGVMSSVIKTLL